MTNEDKNVFVVFNGELFDYVERREELINEGHHLRTHCDTEIIPHLYEDYGEGMWERLRGQFAIALWDERLSTAAVERELIAADVTRARRAAVIDQHAAAFILQGALDRLARG